MRSIILLIVKHAMLRKTAQGRQAEYGSLSWLYRRQQLSKTKSILPDQPLRTRQKRSLDGYRGPAWQANLLLEGLRPVVSGLEGNRTA